MQAAMIAKRPGCSGATWSPSRVALCNLSRIRASTLAACSPPMTEILAFGHTHKPWHRTVNGVGFLNTGSVGRPKDGDPRAGYAIVVLDEETGFSHGIRRVEYDVERGPKGPQASRIRLV